MNSYPLVCGTSSLAVTHLVSRLDAIVTLQDVDAQVTHADCWPFCTKGWNLLIHMLVHSIKAQHFWSTFRRCAWSIALPGVCLWLAELLMFTVNFDVCVCVCACAKAYLQTVISSYFKRREQMIEVYVSMRTYSRVWEDTAKVGACG